MNGIPKIAYGFFFLLVLLFILPLTALSQGTSGGLNEQQKKKLKQFSRIQNRIWIREKTKADSLAAKLNIPLSYREGQRVITLQRLGHKNMPVYYVTHNTIAASVISADLLQDDEYSGQIVTGSGIEVHIWDGGGIRSTHREFVSDNLSRVTMINRNIDLSDHSTHVAGTIAAGGADPQAKGMAKMTNVFGWDYNNDLAEMAIAASEGLKISNHSYGTLCGWYFNSQAESWYWYGDPDLSLNEDYKFGSYDQSSADLDYIAWNAPEYLIIKSAGNDRNDGPENQPVEHYIWDNAWIPVTLSRDPDGGSDGFDCLSPMSVSKNVLTVGAVNDNKELTDFSAFGPADDGRIKPDVMANGMDVYSSLSSSDDDYGVYSGTSMSAASVTGAVALLDHLNNIFFPGVSMKSSTLKALLIHSCEEMGDAPGPDYKYGWGLLNIADAADLMEENAENGGRTIREMELKQGEVINLPLEAGGTEPLKVTLCWTDPPGIPSGVVLNDRNPKLVNDLDIALSFNGNSFLPWKLDRENPGNPASRGLNHVDNVEQILVPDPSSGLYTLKISHSGLLSEEAQSFSLIITGIKTPTGIKAPSELIYHIREDGISLEWQASESALSCSYKIYRNKKAVATVDDNAYEDRQITIGNEYEYFVTALYNIEEKEIESLPTNTVYASIMNQLSLPFVLDFEGGTDGIMIKNDETGWQWGNSEALSSYYLKFGSNTGKFIGTDSYSSGETSHVNDIAITNPLRLGEFKDVSITFDYMLVSGLYNSIDELHIKYKMQDEAEWTEWMELSPAMDWTSKEIDLPGEMLINGMQIGFFYDDKYQWGMGAGLDNLTIRGTPSRLVDWGLTQMNSPESACAGINEQNISVRLVNHGDQTALSGDRILISTRISDGQSFHDTLVLQNNINPGENLDYIFKNKISLNNAGTYLFDFTILSELDQNPANNSLQSSIDIYSEPEVKILNTDLIFCENEPPVLIIAEPTGGTLTGPGINDMMFYPEIALEGSHILNYSWVDDKLCEGTVSSEVQVVTTPEALILNEDLDFCLNESSIEIEVKPEGGILDGTGVTENIFVPSLAGVGIHTLSYSISDDNACKDTFFVEAEVHPLPEPEILNQDLEFCENEQPALIDAVPAGGTLSGPGVDNLLFSPLEAGIGQHFLTYIVNDDNACTGSVTVQTEVNPLPEPEILNQDLEFCENEQPALIDAVPDGGTLSGPGVDNLLFSPLEAGIGQHFLTYIVNDDNACTGSVTVQTEVNPLPEPEILNQDLEFCENEQPALIDAVPAGGTLSGPGVDNLLFSPLEAGIGQHFLTYIVTDNNACTGSVTVQTEVNPMPEPEILNQDLEFCENEQPALIDAVPAGGTLSGPGVDNLLFSPLEAGIGQHFLTYIVNDNNACTGSVTVQTEVNPLPEPEILNKDFEFCENEEVANVDVYPEGGTLTGKGINYFVFDPSAAGTGTHTIIYSYTDNNGCKATAAAEIEVLASPEIEVLNEDLSFCVNEEEILIQTSPEGGTLSGTAVSGMEFHPALAGPGSYSLSYTYTDSANCSSEREFSVEVVPLPSVDLGPDLDLDDTDSVLLLPSGNARSFIWFDGSTQSSYLVQAKNFAEGLHNIWVTGISEENCRSTDSLILNINITGTLEFSESNFTVHPNPFREGFILQLNEDEFPVEVIITGLSGRIISRGIPSAYPFFEMSGLPPGTYIILVKTNKTTQTGKIIKF